MKKSILQTAVLVTALVVSAIAAQAQNLFTPVTDQNAGLSSRELEKLADLRQNPVYQSIQMVHVGDIPALETNGFIDVNIPGGETFHAIAFHISHPNDLSGDFIWEGNFYKDTVISGTHTSESDGNLTLYRKNNEVFGFIRPPFSREVYELASFGPGRNALITYSPDALDNSQEACDNQEPQNPATKVNSLPCNTIKVLALYTRKANDAVPNIYNTILTAMSDLDGATWNSMGNIGQPKFDLVNMVALPDSYVELPDITNTLTNFRLDGYIQGLRDDYAADVVMILTDGNFIDPNLNTEIHGLSVPGLDMDAYAIVEADKCNYKYTFTHEIGHLLGAHHNLCDDGAGYSGCDNVNANLNHPKKIDRFCLFCGNDAKRYETLMWQNNGTSRSHLFSTPDRQIFGKDMGDNDYRNNAKILSNNACTVAGYRSDDDAYYVVSTSGTNIAHTGQTVTLHATPQGGVPPYHYVWKMEAGLFSYTVLGSTTEDVSFPMPNQAHAFVKVRCIDAYGRACEADKTVTNWDYLDYQPITETSTHTQRMAQTGKTEDIAMNIYPNPASESFVISLTIPEKEAGKHSLVISDVMGKIVYSSDQIGSGLVNIEIDGAKFAAGTYIVKLTGGHEPKITKVAITH